jgi:hypothetical protein
MVSLTPMLLSLRERASSTHWTEEWVGLIAGLDTATKRKIFVPLVGIEAQS